MAARNEGVEKRPAPSVAETRVGDVNTDEETRQPVGTVVDGVDDATRDLIVHDTTTRERTVNAKRAHEPLDLSNAEESQPEEDGNGPRAKEVGGTKGSTASTSPLVVSEKQIKDGAAVRDGDRS